MKKPSFPPSQELLAQNYRKMKISGDNKDVRQLVSKLPITHVTTLENVENILRTGTILSIHAQEKQWKFHDRMEVNTDILDRKHWFDKYVFTTFGRTAFHNGWSIALAFPSTKILQTPWVIASAKEIADCGALVSKEAEEIYRDATNKDPALQNRKALNSFMSGIIHWSDFERFFTWFLLKNFSSYTQYLFALTYPGEELKENESGAMNIWWWPQCMIPNSLSLDTCMHIFTRTQREAEYILALSKTTGKQIPVISLENYIKTKWNTNIPPETTDNFLRGMNLMVDDIIEKAHNWQ